MSYHRPTLGAAEAYATDYMADEDQAC